MAKRNSLDTELSTALLGWCREAMDNINDASGYIHEGATLRSVRVAYDRLVSLETALLCVPTHNKK